MDIFSSIFWQIPIGNTFLSSTHFEGATPFKVQVSFDNPIFESQIDANDPDKWLNLLEGYFCSIIFAIRKILLLHSLRLPPMSRNG